MSASRNKQIPNDLFNMEPIPQDEVIAEATQLEGLLPVMSYREIDHVEDIVQQSNAVCEKLSKVKGK